MKRLSIIIDMGKKGQDTKKVESEEKIRSQENKERFMANGIYGGKKMKIDLSKKEIKMILKAIDEKKEYSTEWDNLYGKIKGELDEN